jgi:hypothetical protein
MGVEPECYLIPSLWKRVKLQCEELLAVLVCQCDFESNISVPSRVE